VVSAQSATVNVDWIYKTGLVTAFAPALILARSA
jgi:hypothetical protein